ncbi:MAG TPA: tRNA dihydrouridine synthase DusB [Planctomycetes bacterium]|nr:tRNA dihydrouridine synthase DusB [Planctomycetota bacterium]
MRIGRLELKVPVVLAPMAGVTNAPYRALCRSFGQALYVSEMISARGVLENNKKTLHLASFFPDEHPKSLQLFAKEPQVLEKAARILTDQGIEHLDLNLGCPVRKLTATGGGSALPYKQRRLKRLLAAFRRGAPQQNLSIKIRLGIDEDHLTWRETGRIAQEEGMDAVALHGRTAAQLYDGEADWDPIAELSASLRIPVLGNGDLFDASDALLRMRQTGCAGVVIGRGCLGRPWLFRELEALFSGHSPPPPPNFGEIKAIIRRHGELLLQFFGPELGPRHLRKFAAWYTKGFPGTNHIRDQLVRIKSLEECLALMEHIPDDCPFPPRAIRAKRCKKGGRQRVALPPGWLDSRECE